MNHTVPPRALALNPTAFWHYFDHTTHTALFSLLILPRLNHHSTWSCVTFFVPSPPPHPTSVSHVALLSVSGHSTSLETVYLASRNMWFSDYFSFFNLLNRLLGFPAIPHFSRLLSLPSLSLSYDSSFCLSCLQKSKIIASAGGACLMTATEFHYVVIPYENVALQHNKKRTMELQVTTKRTGHRLPTLPFITYSA